MSTHHDLWIVARARMRLIESEMQSASTRVAPERRWGVLLAHALRRASTLLLSAGSWLNCRADRLLHQAGGKGMEEGVANPC